MDSLPVPPQCWWAMCLESTLDWPSLRPYHLQDRSITSVLDPDGESDHYQPDPVWASLHLPKQDVATQQLGALDDHDEMTERVDRFMRYIHAKQPVVKPQRLYDQIKVVQEEGLGWDANTCLLLIACALGGICTPYDHSSLEDYSKPSIDAKQYLRSREYFDAARKRLGLVMGHANVTGAQCFFLVAGYYVTIFEPLAAWRSLNTASIICQHVLARNTISAGTPSPGRPASDTDNTHRKLFWSCLKTEREIANELGFNISNLHLIKYESQPALVPESEPYEAAGEPEPEAGQPAAHAQGLTPEQHEQSWFYYLTDIALRKLEIQIDAFFSQQRARQADLTLETRESFYGDILATLAGLDKQITDHFEQLPACIAVETGGENHCDDDLREYLRLRMLIIRHTLSRPALHFVLHDTLRDLSRPLLSQATQIAERALMIDAYLVTHGLTTHRHPGTWLGVRYCARAALELYAAAKASVPGLALPLGWDTGMANVKIALTYWGTESRDARMYLEWLERLGMDASVSPNTLFS